DCAPGGRPCTRCGGGRSRLASVLGGELTTRVVEVDVVEGRPRDADRFDADSFLLQRGKDPGECAVAVLDARHERATLAAALGPGAEPLEYTARVVHAAFHQLEVHGVALQRRLQLAGRALD